MNIVVLQGTLSREPDERTLASGTTVMNWELSTPTAAGKRMVPIQWDDPSAAVQRVGVGDEVVVLGTIRRRFFRTGGVTASRTEVLASQMAKPTQKATAAKLVAAAIEQLAS